jgi:hypothetical protein
MEWAGLFNLFQSWGPSAISSVLVFVVIFLIRKVDKNSIKDELRANNLRDEITKTLNDFGTRLSRVEMDYVTKEEYWRDLSGWRSEINRVSDKIDIKFDSLVQNIISVLNQGGK